MSTSESLPKIKKLTTKIMDSFILLVKQRGIRAEFQSALAFFLLAIWVFSPMASPANTVFKDVLLKIFPQHLCIVWFLIIGILQTVGNIFSFSRIRIYSAFLSCLTWAALALAGILTIGSSVFIPLALSFFVAQALVFIHLDSTGGK